MSNRNIESGLAAKVSGLSIKGVVCAVPKAEIPNSFFYETFGKDSVEDVIKMIGVHTRRWASDEQTAADLCQESAETLMLDLGWERDSVDALIFVSQTPDYRLPATAAALQGRMCMSTACAAFDVNLGCSGYAYSLWLASRLLDGKAVKRILLLVGDTISKTINSKDRSTALLFGDAGSATAIEYDATANDSHFILGTDGAGERNLIIPKGAFKKFYSDDVRLIEADPSCLFMDGSEIFTFTLKRVPQLVDDLLLLSDKTRNEIDAYLFHQANAFMLKHIIKKSKIPAELAPSNMGVFGNTSCVSIPLLIVDQLRDIGSRSMTIALFGFGVGYSWSAALLNFNKITVSKLVEI